jgi:D-3-phosphoglycerate dehydrogenase / 2-oxoglutarate reductase
MQEQLPRVVVACSEETWKSLSASNHELRHLAGIAEVRFVPVDVPSGWTEPPPPSPEAEALVVQAAQDAVALLIHNGSPLVDEALLDKMPTVRFVGEFGGDRFSSRVDVEACWRRGVRVVDTNNSVSYPVAEWALTLTLMGTRNFGAIWRRTIVDRTVVEPGMPDKPLPFQGELTGKTVGLIGFGHIARRLSELLEPFDVSLYAHDPYVPIELAEPYRVTLTSMENVLHLSDVVCCLVPITPATRRMIGKDQIALLRPGCVFVNVSRGAVVDHDALLKRLRRGDIVACLDVFDPEPVPSDSPFLDLPNVILSPHIAGASGDGGARGMQFMVEELARHLAGHETRFDLLPRTLENRRGLSPGSLTRDR